MEIGRLENLIDGADFSQMTKYVFKGFVHRAKENEDKRVEIIDLIEKVYGKRTLENISIMTDELVIFKIIGREGDENEESWDTKYPYRGIFFKDDKWNRIHTVCTCVDEVLLTYLGEKYLGGNSQFADFAMKMLEMRYE